MNTMCYFKFQFTLCCLILISLNVLESIKEMESISAPSPPSSRHFVHRNQGLSTEKKWRNIKFLESCPVCASVHIQKKWTTGLKCVLKRCGSTKQPWCERFPFGNYLIADFLCRSKNIQLKVSLQIEALHSNETFYRTKKIPDSQMAGKINWKEQQRITKMIENWNKN